MKLGGGGGGGESSGEGNFLKCSFDIRINRIELLL